MTQCVWAFNAEHPESALERREEFLNALERSAGGNIDRFGAALIYNELVANVIQHARGPIALELFSRGPQATLQVKDGGKGFMPRPRLPDSLYEESGRGLFLISYYASDLKVAPVERNGTCVSVTFPVRNRAGATVS